MNLDDSDDLPIFYRRFRDGEAVRVYQSIEDTLLGYSVVGINEDGEGRAFETGHLGWIMFEKIGTYAVRMDGIDDDYYFFPESALEEAKGN